MYNKTQEYKSAAVYEHITKEEKLETILERLGVRIDQVIVVINGRIEIDPERIITSKDKILIMPALVGG